MLRGGFARKTFMNIEDIAVICHEANRIYCLRIGDNTQQEWANAEQWQRESAINGVKWRLENPESPASAQHDAWIADKLTNGWKYGLAKNAETKEHPCMVEYELLPVEQKAKDALFVNIVNALKPLLSP